MSDHLQVIYVRGTKPFHTVDKGESVVFALQLGKTEDEYQDIDFLMPYQMLMPFINSLLNLGIEADKLRAMNPIHQSGVQSGWVLDLDTCSIGPHTTRKDSHVLQLGVRASRGATRYLIGAGRLQLENLVEVIQEYLDNPESLDQAPKH
jgi:hypothetical protein